MKEKINLPKRSDPIYQEIEGYREDNPNGFKDYEYTNCIAFEMAIRNNDFVKNIIEDINELNNDFLSSSLNSKKFSYYKRYALSILREHGIREDRLYEIKKIKKLYGIAVIDFLLENINHEIDFIDELSAELKEGYEIKQYGVPQDYNDYDLNPAVNNIVTPNFARPYFKYKDGVNVEFELNLALPIDELIAYVSKIKDEYDKNNSIIKNPLELLGKDLDKADENLLIHKGTGRYNKHRVADMFFIYDGMKKGMKKSKIISELNYYYYDKNEKDTNYDYKTLDKYYGIAIDLIDNLKYKELITGIKN